jgi:hypothetical protein
MTYVLIFPTAEAARLASRTKRALAALDSVFAKVVLLPPNALLFEAPADLEALGAELRDRLGLSAFYLFGVSGFCGQGGLTVTQIPCFFSAPPPGLDLN